jgi:S-adenosylmethionine hydrolase
MSTTPPILTLTTDFGADGPYVAAMKGVVLTLAPGTSIVDVSHRIAPQNILEGAFVLASVIEAFPPETVHLGVVDPGVGTDRPLVAMRVAGQWVVGPDNGLLSGVARLHRPEALWQISSPTVRRPVVSDTFHGRDILAPAAAHLLLGRDPADLGPPREKVVHLANFAPRDTDSGLVGEVIFRDAFGNLVTNIRRDDISAAGLDHPRVEVGRESVHGLVRTYADRRPGELVALFGSSGWLEVAQVNGDAGRHLAVGPGTTVWIHPGAPHA